MNVKIQKTDLGEILPFRKLFLHENNFQFICNKCHENGWADTYAFFIDDHKIGYGAVWGTDKREDRDAIFEYYIIPPFRKFASLVFTEFHKACGALIIECQSNDPLLASMLYEYTKDIYAEAILFEDDHQTHLSIDGAVLRKKPGTDKGADVGGYYLEQNGEEVATGGFMLNYNLPYADIYMEVKENCRMQGFGSLIVQELKKEIYLMGRVPAARCNINNHASKATILKAGFRVCGQRLKGELKI